MQGDPKAVDRVSAEVMTVSETAAMLRRRLEAMDGELRASVASLRGCLEKLADGLSALEREVASLRGEDGDGTVSPVEGVMAAQRVDDEEGARLVALNMALNGERREVIDRYLAEHFVLDERSRLLDEVCAAAAGQ